MGAVFCVTIVHMSLAKFRKVSKGYSKPKNNDPKKEQNPPAVDTDKK